jgi:ZIP family zinc transporter
MLYISFIEIFSKAKISLMNVWGNLGGYWITIASFFGGILLIAIIDRFVPEAENPHELKRIEDIDHPSEAVKKQKLLRMDLMSALVIGIHNFPEGIAISLPVYYATGDKRKAFRLSFLSGLAEPAGAMIGFLILMPFLNDIIFGILFASVAGIMVYISIDELLPAAREYGQAHMSIYGVIAGMIVMAVSLLLFE